LSGAPTGVASALHRYASPSPLRDVPSGAAVIGDKRTYHA
jgi:hypothetical protein